MKVECKISADYKEPYAVLHINEMTDTVAEMISMLEKENITSPTLRFAGYEPNEGADTDRMPRGLLTAAKGRKTYFIKQENISLVRTEGREIVCYDQSENRYLLDKPLYELETILDIDFVRISKSTIVNINQINHVEASFNGTMELVMKNGITDYISRSFRKSFKERLGLE